MPTGNERDGSRPRTHPIAGHPAGLDRCLDLSGPARPPAGDRARCPGRKQYRYHPKWRVVRDETKYDRVIGFAQALPSIRRTTSDHLRRQGLPREKVLATVVQLLEKTLIRVGNDEYAFEPVLRIDDDAGRACRGERRGCGSHFAGRAASSTRST